MAEPVRKSQEEPARPDISHLIMEDDEPMDNWFQEREQRLLPDILYASWKPGRPFLAAANVGLFHKVAGPGIVPDAMVSLDVEVPAEWWKEHNRSYLAWELGKSPEIVIEIVSNNRGGEEAKLVDYAQAGVPYYAIFDPRLYISKRPLRVFALHAGRYVDLLDPSWLEHLGLGLTLWEGDYEGMTATWLRWRGPDGSLLPTGAERADQERQRADHERQRADQECQRADQECQRADQERQRADQERQRAERLEEKLRELGMDPD